MINQKYIINTFNKICLRIALVTTAALLSSCATPEKYQASPIAADENIRRFHENDLSSESFTRYLRLQNHPQAQVPIEVWGLTALSLSAYFHHPQLDVARAQLDVAQSGIVIAKQSPTPTISGTIENHSKNNGNISPSSVLAPWSFGIALDIPIQRSKKRIARIEEAEHLTEAAKIEISASAWKIRSQVRNDLIALQAAKQQLLLLEQEQAARAGIAKMLNTRLEVGLISNNEVNLARLHLQKAQHALSAEQARIPELRAALASSAGLPLSKLEKVKIQDQTFSLPNPHTLSSQTFQKEALLNRLDVRAALSKYAAREAKLRLEIAKQIPDISLSPGYLFDQGDQIWSLGISALLNALQPVNNKGMISKARALRQLEAAQFYALQASIIGETERSYNRYKAALAGLNRAQSLLETEQKRYVQLKSQFDLGLIDRLTITHANLNTLQSKQSVLSAKLNLQYALAAIEDAMQKPITPKEAAYTEAATTKISVKEITTPSAEDMIP